MHLIIAPQLATVTRHFHLKNPANKLNNVRSIELIVRNQWRLLPEMGDRWRLFIRRYPIMGTPFIILHLSRVKNGSDFFARAAKKRIFVLGGAQKFDIVL